MGPMRALVPAFLAAGALATTTQVLVLRELLVSVAGDETAIGVGLAAWLAGIGLGAAGARRLTRLRDAATAPPLLAALALAPALGVLAPRLLRGPLGPPAGELPGAGLALALGLATLAPAGAVAGSLFTALASLAARAGTPAAGLARLYRCEALGSLAGGAGTALALFTSAGPLGTAVLAGAGALVLSAPAWVFSGPVRLAPAAALLALLAASPTWPRLDHWSERARFAALAPGATLLEAVHTPYQHLALGSGGGALHLYASGQYSASFPDPYGEEMRAHLLACLVDRPGRVLALGGLERGALRFLLSHPVDSVTVVEPDAAAFALLRRHLPEADRRALDDPRVRVVHDDPRRFLSVDQGRHDLLLLLQGDPVTLLRARLTTVEHFRLAATRLAPRGLLVVSLRTAPEALAGDTEALAGSVYGALAAALPVVRATPGPDTLLVAARSPAAVDLGAATLASRWASRGVVSGVFHPALLPLLLPAERMAETEDALRRAARATLPGSDERPVSFAHALARRQSETASRLGHVLARAVRLPPAALCFLALAPSLGLLTRLACRRPSAPRRSAAAVHAVAVTGASALAWSLLVLFSFQARAGALYGQLGLLTGLLMLGLALGASVRPRLGPALLAALAFGLLLRGALGLAPSAPWAARSWHGALLLAAGAVTGAVFVGAVPPALAAHPLPADAAGRLAAADHLGAAVSALAAAVLLVPALGTGGTALLLAALQALALAGVVLGDRQRS